jgi:putative SOS response-associated peptidase YedK
VAGRFTLTRTAEQLIDELGLVDLPETWRPRYNVAPTQPVLVVDSRRPAVARWARWGLIPAWARDAQVGARTINARAETLEERPSFRGPFRDRRCGVLADGFYEWTTSATGKQPVYFRLRGHRPFLFAGLWDTWRAPDGVEIRSDRMPVILRGRAVEAWLARDTAVDELRALLTPLGAGSLVAHAVGTFVNSPANDDPRCIEPGQLGLGL